MKVNEFLQVFRYFFPDDEIAKPSPHFEDRFSRSFFDTCFDVEGMMSIKKQKLLNIAFACLAPEEAYLEVGTYMGKSLVSAMQNNPQRTVYACDNFSEFTATNSLERLVANLRRYNFRERVQIFDADFRQVVNKEHMPVPIGLYFNDGAHDEESQYQGIKLAEPLLANEALVLVDDWCLAADSGSYAKAGTERAAAESPNEWTFLYDLPARYNGDQGLWWNGVGVYSFRRR